MKFIIQTNKWFLENRPCEEAFLTTYMQYHIRTATEEEYNKKFSDVEGLWRSKGTNHTVNKYGYIVREEGLQEDWGIEFDTLEQIDEFRKKYDVEIVVIMNEYYNTLNMHTTKLSENLEKLMIKI